MHIRQIGLTVLLVGMALAGAGVEADELPDETAAETVAIAFATNRSINDGEQGPDRFGDEAGALKYGICRVEFDPIGFLKDAARHISLRFPTDLEEIVEIEEMDADSFWAGFGETAAANDSKSVFYIHGYKMDFGKACRRTALLQRQLGEEVRLLLFAWPSQDNLALYTRDETLMKISVPDIRSVLNHMLEAGGGSVDAIGHSLGTRGITAAIAGMDAGETPVFDELILVAPDMDHIDFDEARPGLAKLVAGTTIYVSENDGALKVSQEVHGMARIGQAGEFLTLFEGVETVDISEAPRRDIYGHNYHYFNPRVISDMRILLTAGTRAGERPGLLEQSFNGRIYWKMTGDGE